MRARIEVEAPRSYATLYSRRNSRDHDEPLVLEVVSFVELHPHLLLELQGLCSHSSSLEGSNIRALHDVSSPNLPSYTSLARARGGVSFGFGFGFGLGLSLSACCFFGFALTTSHHMRPLCRARLKTICSETVRSANKQWCLPTSRRTLFAPGST